jgi:putative ABC transport system permease protein
MLGHYLTVSFRTLRRTPVLTLIKLLALSLGLACFVVAYAMVSYWRHSERGFAKAERTYMMTTRITLSDGTDTGPQPRLDQDRFDKLRLAFPTDFETVARARGAGVVPVAAGDEKTRLHGSYADPAFLDVFELPFVAGDPRTALTGPSGAVLTEDAAQRLFGTRDVIGRTFLYAGIADLTVTGVIGAIAQPSHIGPATSAVLRFDVLASWDVLDRVSAARRAAGYSAGAFYPQLGYVVLPASSRATPESLAPRLAPMGETEVEKDLVTFTIGMLPIRDLIAKQLDSALFANTHVAVSVPTLLLLLGVLVLVVACVNYVNLATAQALRRAKEVGLRKAIGAEAHQIVAQHVLEAMLMTALAFLFAIGIVALASPLLRAAAGVDLALVLSDARFLGITLPSVVATGLLAGAYPALVLSRVRPTWALKSRDARGARGTASALLVGVQFAVASFLVIAIVVMQQQAAQLRRTALAGSEDPLIVVTNASAFTGVDTASLEDQLRALPSVKGVAGMANPPWEGGNRMAITLMTDPTVPASLRTAVMTAVDHDFFATMNMRVVAGRVFEREHANRSMFDYDTERPSTLVVDEAFARMIGFAEPERAVGRLVYLPYADLFQAVEIVGVIANQPLQFSGAGSDANVYDFSTRTEQILVRLDKNDVGGALRAIERVWEQRVPNHAFEYEFEDQLFARGYAVFQRVTDAFALLASLACAICVIGLVGMAGHMTGRRRREIGVRKTFGATWQSVLGLLLAAFSKPVIAANVIAWPFAYLAVKAYLAIFIQRVPLTPWPFVASSALTLLVAWAAVAVQSYRAARVEPAAVLRDE